MPRDSALWRHTGGTLYHTRALQRGQVGHLLDRRDERLQPFHVPIVADVVARYAVNGGGGGVYEERQLARQRPTARVHSTVRLSAQLTSTRREPCTRAAPWRALLLPLRGYCSH